MFSPKPPRPASSPHRFRTCSPNRVPFVLLDVRTRAEHLGGHIPGSTLLPSTSSRTGGKRPAGPERQNRRLLREWRPQRAGGPLLLWQGYTDVSDLGGIMGWVSSGSCDDPRTRALCLYMQERTVPGDYLSGPFPLNARKDRSN